MIQILMDSFSKYYGLDWLSFATGLAGMYLLTQKRKTGFLLSGVAYLSGIATAAIAQQFGFVFYNFALIFLMYRGYQEWKKPVGA